MACRACRRQRAGLPRAAARTSTSSLTLRTGTSTAAGMGCPGGVGAQLAQQLDVHEGEVVEVGEDLQHALPARVCGLACVSCPNLACHGARRGQAALHRSDTKTVDSGVTPTAL